MEFFLYIEKTKYIAKDWLKCHDESYTAVPICAVLHTLPGSQCCGSRGSCCKVVYTVRHKQVVGSRHSKTVDTLSSLLHTVALCSDANVTGLLQTSLKASLGRKERYFAQQHMCGCVTQSTVGMRGLVCIHWTRSNHDAAGSIRMVDSRNAATAPAGKRNTQVPLATDYHRRIRIIMIHFIYETYLKFYELDMIFTESMHIHMQNLMPNSIISGFQA